MILTPNLLCLTISEWFSLGQILATLLIGFATLRIYIIITKMSTKASEVATEKTTKHTNYCKLNDDLNRIVEYTIQYPYFDDDIYKESYASDIKSLEEAKRERALRYEAFAIMTFNFICDLVTYYNGNEEEMAQFCDYKELIESHKKYWEHRVLKEKECGYESIEDLVNKTLKKTDQLS